MPDESTYGFNKDDATDILAMIQNGEDWFPEIKPRGKGGGGGQVIEFQIESDVYETESYDWTVDDSEKCDDQNHSEATSKRARIVARPCGVNKVKGEVDGYVTVHDTSGKFLEERSDEEIEGKSGFAALLQTDEYQSECQWVIIWINWFRVAQVVTDIIIADNQIRIERKNIKVWDACDLEDEIIEGTDCIEEYYEG